MRTIIIAAIFVVTACTTEPAFEYVPLKAFRGIVLESGPVGAFDMVERIRDMPVPPWITS